MSAENVDPIIVTVCAECGIQMSNEGTEDNPDWAHPMYDGGEACPAVTAARPDALAPFEVEHVKMVDSRWRDRWRRVAYSMAEELGLERSTATAKIVDRYLELDAVDELERRLVVDAEASKLDADE